MTPRPFHRWKSFWFGVLVIAFLGWAWVRSGRVFDAGAWEDQRSRTRFSLYQHDSRIVVAWSLKRFAASFRKLNNPGFRTNSIPVNHLKLRFPAPIAIVDESHYDRELAVAHWFLILLFLAPWFGWLAWRWRRIKSLDAYGPEICK